MLGGSVIVAVLVSIMVMDQADEHGHGRQGCQRPGHTPYTATTYTVHLHT